jgi:hypothetical protein
MDPRPTCLLVIAAVLAATPTFAQTIVAPPAGRWSVTPAYVFQHARHFWNTDDRQSFDDPRHQHSLLLMTEYGLTDRLSADLTLGAAHLDSTAFGRGETDSGLTDTLLGLRWNFLGRPATTLESPGLALRIGTVLPGNYDPDIPFPIGNGVMGAEASLLFGGRFGRIGPGLLGDFGYRHNSGHVPDNLHASLTLFQTWRRWTLSGGFQWVHALSGIDMNDASFDSTRFPRLRERSKQIEAGLAYAADAGPQYQVFLARTVDGRNTPQQTLFAASVTFSF